MRVQIVLHKFVDSELQPAQDNMLGVDEPLGVILDIVFDFLIDPEYFVNIACSSYSLDDIAHVLADCAHVVGGLRPVDGVRQLFLELVV